MATQEKTFVTCTLKYLDKTFKTRQVRTLPSLDQWLTRPADISDVDRQVLLRFQAGLEFNVHDWNEYELDSHFIGPLFALIDFSSPAFNHFGQRDLEATIDDTLLYGRVDGMIASGFREPEQPFFAFQRSDVSEYKRNLDPNGDPAGQCLAAMLVGQALNQADQPTDPALPLYGCYVVGELWRFVALEGRQYATSPGYSATSDDLFDIFRILKALKQLVSERVVES
jgi:hypothetical protein